MLKKSALAASMIAIFAATPSLAQDAKPPVAPAEKMETMEKTDPALKPAAPSATTRQDNAAAYKDKSAAQTTTHGWRASNLINAAIVNASNESIGDINDLIISSNGSVEAVVVGVGGFLGIGEKNVALPFSDLAFTKNQNGKTVIMSKVTKASLEQMPEWKAPEKL